MKFNSNLPKHPIIIAIGNTLIRQKLQNLVLSSGFELITLIHPTTVIGSDVAIDNGSVVIPGAIINAKSTIGNGVIINSGAIIEHECIIGDFAHICPGVAIAGGSLVGERSWIGIGSSVIQNITIKPDITIGAGSVVVKDILIAHVTSPMIKDETIAKCILEYESNLNKFDSLATVNSVKHFLWLDNKPINYNPDKKPRSQDLPNIISLNHAINILPLER